MSVSTIKMTKTVLDEIFAQSSIPTTATSYSCPWGNYDFLIVRCGAYNNTAASITVPTSKYFDNTSSSARIQLPFPNVEGLTYTVYQNGSNAIYAAATTVDANRYLRIWGVRVRG